MPQDPPLRGPDGPGIPAAGEIIAFKYEVERVLGAGGMGVVLAARHKQLGQRVAIKFIRGEAARDDNAVGRFLREARAAVALSSEHVAKVFDVGTLETGEPYIVMEYLEGTDLGEVLRRLGPMSPGDAVGHVLQGCEAIAEAHAIGIVHRDLKPSNLFLLKRRDGTPLVKVLDFGISKMSDFNTEGATGTLTASGLVMGSPGYMSPEQVRNSKDVDERSDVWSIGVIFYELLTGVGPFIGDTLGDTLARIVSETPRPIRSLRPAVPEGLAAVIAQCLERRIDRRVQSVGELAWRLSPFAPREAALSIERILRIYAPQGAPGEGPRRTFAAPETMTAVPFEDREAGDAVAGSERSETERAWQSNAGSATGAKSIRRANGTLILALSLPALALVAGLVILTTQRRAAAPAASRVESPSTQGSAPAPSSAATSPPSSTPDPAAGESGGVHLVAATVHDRLEGQSRADAGDMAPARPAAKQSTGVAHGAHAPSRPETDPSLDGLLDRRE